MLKFIMEIYYKKHNEIDFNKWDNCIGNAFNGIIYAFSWYLNTVCEDWEALVGDDYKYVMPLTYRKKYGIYYLYQPLVTQQLGVFSGEKLDQEKVDSFLEKIPGKFKLIEISLNSFNKTANRKFVSKQNKTYQLDLIIPYESLQKNYSTNTKRNISRAKKNKISIIGSPSINDLINLLSEDKSQKKMGFKVDDFSILRQLISNAVRFRMGKIIGAYDDFNNLCAAAFFVSSHTKTIFLLAVSNRNAIDKRAMFLLIDDFIKNNAGKNITLDFEGSNLHGVARFYSGFGAQPCDYLSIRRNRLPFPLKLLKK